MKAENTVIQDWKLSPVKHPFTMVLWKRLATEMPQKKNHKTNLVPSYLNLKLKRLYSKDFHSHGRSARSPSRSARPPP